MVMMLDIKDLRIGTNIMQEGCNCVVSPSVLLDFITNPEAFEPLPLGTYELYHLGFMPINPTSTVFHRDGIHLSLIKNNCYTYDWETTIEFNYVHEIQNFMWVICKIDVPYKTYINEKPVK